METRRGSATMRAFRLRLPDVPPAPGPEHAAPRDRVLRVRAPADYTVPRILRHRGLAGFEPDTLALFLALLGTLPRGTFFDVGANTGVFSLLGAATSRWEIVAFEPMAELAATIADNAAHNDLPIVVEQRALGSTTGTATLYLSSISDSSNSLVPGFRPSSESVEVPVETLDADVARTGRHPALLKIDVETAEPEVLAGAADTLRRDRPWIICEVLGAETERAVAELLGELGYAWYQITPDHPLVRRREIFGDRAAVYTNWLFAPEEPRDAVWAALRSTRRAIAACVPLEEDRSVVERPVPPFAAAGSTELAAAWEPGRHSRRCTFRVASERIVTVDCDLPPDGKVYLTHGSSNMDRPPEDASWCAIEAGRRYELLLDVAVASGRPGIQLWAIQYGPQARLAHRHVDCAPGRTRLAIEPERGATSVRAAIRISGSGTAAIGPLQLNELA